MDRFSEQLANLQRAASRAGTDNNNNGNGNNNNRGNNNNSGRSYRRDESYNFNHNHRRDRERRQDDRYDSSHSRKRGRYDDRRSYDDRGRFYNNDRRGGRYNGNYRHDNNGGDRGGRWRENYESNNHSNSEQRNSSSRQTETLAELVSIVKTKYQASQNNLVGNDEKVAHVDKRRHIALLFLTIDDLPHEHVWREWLKSCSSNEVGEFPTNSSKQDDSSSVQNDTPLVSVLCHAKFPDRIKSEWLRQRHLMKQSQSHNQVTNDDNMPRFHSHRPEWGSVEITRAMIDLVEEALRIGTSESTNSMKYLSTQGNGLLDNNASTNETASTGYYSEQDIPRVDRFIFVSESCLPVTTLEEVEMALFGPKTANNSAKSLYDKSWVNARSTPNNGYAKQQQWDAIRIDNIPRDYIWKADQVSSCSWF